MSTINRIGTTSHDFRGFQRDRLLGVGQEFGSAGAGVLVVDDGADGDVVAAEFDGVDEELVDDVVSGGQTQRRRVRIAQQFQLLRIGQRQPHRQVHVRVVEDGYLDLHFPKDQTNPS